jgi:hypothetical protein
MSKNLRPFIVSSKEYGPATTVADTVRVILK